MRRAPGIFLSVLPILLLLFAPASVSEQGPKEEFGEVAFVNSGPAAAQADFLRGLAQLHNFEYEDAAEYFRKAEQVAPEFALAF